MIALLTSRAGLTLAAAAAVLALLGGLYLLGRSDGAATAARRQAEAAQHQANERAKADVEADRDPAPVDRLRRDWSR